ncbi:MAG: ribonuclease H family protein [Paludibacteraceae bacterium]|nr:ribonuclease H family protein [Paludibacteraceae bacterium]
MGKVNFYVVWKGRETGIFESWAACEQQVKGVAAQYKGFATREEAEKALAEGAEKYIAPRSSVNRQKCNAISVKDLSPTEMQQHGVLLPALAVDAAYSGNPGKLEFRGVIADTGTQVFHRGPYIGGTNNIGEFLAIVLGLAYLQKHNLPWVLYSDSKTAIAWIKQKKCKTQLEWNAENQELLLAVRAAEKWLSEHTWTTPIYKWNTEHWGEIPADFGRK